MTWTIKLDDVLCQGHGVCESEAPDVFVVPKHARTVTILHAQPEDALRAGVELAVQYCPTHALRIEEN
jgi:ferredoxin